MTGSVCCSGHERFEKSRHVGPTKIELVKKVSVAKATGLCELWITRSQDMDVGGWLRKLGLGRYKSAFIENAIDSDVLAELTEADLEKLGIALGDRKRLIKAIRAMRDDTPSALTTSDVVAPVATTERRHLTVMICDLVGSTALSAQLDPEEMGAVMQAYQAVCARAVQAYDGVLGDFRGDGILAYFGYPRAHEDDAERTVRAALDIAAAVGRLNTRAVEPLAVRIGIASGLVMVGAPSGEGGWKHVLVGDTPNVAARLQALVEPGTVVVAASTRRLIGNLSICVTLVRMRSRVFPGW